MGERNSFTSLMAMVESHLSKTSVSESGGAAPSFSLPNICSARRESERPLPQLPRLQCRDTELGEILARQMTNMLVARGRREGAPAGAEPALKDDYTIDLSACIVRGESDARVECVALSSTGGGSVESLCSEPGEVQEVPACSVVREVLPLCDDLSHMALARVRRGSCSPFGRVLAARARVPAAPYLHPRRHPASVQRFDFSSPSPCDVNLERRLRPHPDLYAHMNMVDRFMATTADEP